MLLGEYEGAMHTYQRTSHPCCLTSIQQADSFCTVSLTDGARVHMKICVQQVMCEGLGCQKRSYSIRGTKHLVGIKVSARSWG